MTCLDNPFHSNQKIRMQNYFYRDKLGKEIGPLNLTTLAQLRFAGVLNDETLVRSTDSDKWIPCREVVAVHSAPSPAPSQPISVGKEKSFLAPVLIGLVTVGALVCGGTIVYKSIAAKTALTYEFFEDGKELPRNQTPEVKVDGQLFENGDHLKPGRHEISVRLENVEPYERHFWLFYGTKDLGNLPLETSKGGLIVTVNPSPATVIVQRGGHEHLMKDLVVRSVPSDTDEVIPPAPPYYFNDYAHVVSSAMVSRLNTMLENYERQSSDQILVAVFPKMQSDAPIKSYTLRVANSWKVGQKAKNNGVALFVFVQDRKMYVQVGTGLENELPDATCQQILDTKISPRLKEGDFDGGLSAGVTAIIAAIKGAHQGNGLTVAKRSNAVANPSENNLILQRSGEVVCQGAAPLSVEKLPVGNYTLVVKRGDYEETRTVDIQRQQTTKEIVELNLGVVELSSDPAGADYEMSGNGHHWQDKLPARVEDVPVGDYSLSVTRRNWELDSNGSVVRGTITTNRTEFSYGSIEVTSKPTGLVVSTNGVEIGKTPITLQELKPAFYNLTVSDGENDLMAQIQVGPKENGKHDFAFRYGMVQLTSAPTGATVFRKGKAVGKTPITLEHIPAGESAVELRLDGYVFTNFAFVGVADTTTSYAVNLVSEKYLSDLSEARSAAAGSPPDYSQALAKIAEALKIYPDNADALQLQKDYQFGLALNEASALLDKGDLDQASTKIDGALVLKPFDKNAIAVKQKIAGAKAQRDLAANVEANRQSDEKAKQAGEMFQQHIAKIFNSVKANPFYLGAQPFAFKPEAWRVHASPAQAETAMMGAANLCTPVWQVESKAQPLSSATEYHLRQKVLLGSAGDKLEVQICELPNKDVDIRASLVMVIPANNDPNYTIRARQAGLGYFTTFISHYSHALQANPLAQIPPVNSPPSYEQRRVVTQPANNYKY